MLSDEFINAIITLIQIFSGILFALLWAGFAIGVSAYFRYIDWGGFARVAWKLFAWWLLIVAVGQFAKMI